MSISFSVLRIHQYSERPHRWRLPTVLGMARESLKLPNSGGYMG
jgi:hypothetical protein